MTNSETKCDDCGAVLSKPSAMPGFMIEMRAVPTPTGPMVCAVHVTPPFNGTMHFCGNKCLYHWMTSTHATPMPQSPGGIIVGAEQ